MNDKPWTTMKIRKDLAHWLGIEAARRTVNNGDKVTSFEVGNEAVAFYRAFIEKQKAEKPEQTHV